MPGLLCQKDETCSSPEVSALCKENPEEIQDLVKYQEFPDERERGCEWAKGRGYIKDRLMPLSGGD